MVKIQDKLVDAKGLKSFYGALANWINQVFSDFNDRLNNRLYDATNIPVPGQILIADDSSSWSWKNMPSSSVDEATVRRIVNEQIAKMKFTINDQGHLIIETPEA